MSGPRIRSRRARSLALRVGLLVPVIVLVAIPMLDPGSSILNYGVLTLMFVGLASAWNIMGGFTGYISLGHAGFFGLGAYSTGLLVAHLHLTGDYDSLLMVPLTGVITAALAFPVGWIALRTRAATFVIVTISVLFMLQLLATNLKWLTGGAQGLSYPIPHWDFTFYEVPFYYAMLILAVLTIAISWWIRRSKFGLGLLAIRDDEDKALAVGVPTGTYKLVAFVVSAALVGMIAGVWGYYQGYIYPAFAFDPLVSISMVLMAFLGGMGTVSGPVIGALLLKPAQLLLAYYVGASRLYLLMYAAVFLVVIQFLPQGIVPSAAALVARVRRRRNGRLGSSSAVTDNQAVVP
jgi:branched-chain amino acid transport system permease protein